MWRMLMQFLLPMLMRNGAQGADGQNPFGGPFGSPFGGATSGAQADDGSPINVDAEVYGEDGKTDSERAHDEWDSKTRAERPQLQGEHVFQGSRSYNIGIAALCLVVLLAGAVLRVYSLVQGCIFSSVVVPVVLGAIPAFLLLLIGAVIIWRKGNGLLPMNAIDLLLMFFSSAIMGYAYLISFLLATLVAWIYQHAKHNGAKLPFIIPFAVFALVQGVLFSFPGLCFTGLLG